METQSLSDGVTRKGWFKGPLPRVFKPIFFVLALLPLVALVVGVITGNAGENPIETVEKDTGEWALRFLVLSLIATPLGRWLKSSWPLRMRRMIGLFAFFYAAVHLLSFLWLDHWFNWEDIFSDVIKRPFVTAGFASFLILLPLAVTSNRRAVKRLAERWFSLHRWVYFAGVLAVVHYVWLAKGDQIEPVVYLLIIIALLVQRLTVLLRDSTA